MRRDSPGWDCVGCMVNGFVEMKREAVRLGFHRGPQDVPAGPPNVVDAFRVAKERYDDDAFTTRGIELSTYAVVAEGWSSYLGTEVQLLAPPAG